MKVIALYGKANTGKTSTLNTVVERLKTLGARIIDTEKNDSNNADRRYIIELDDGRRVCITTAGDYSETQDANYNFVKVHKPEIWVTASHEKDGSIDSVKKSFQEGYTDYVIWIRKLYPMMIIQNETIYRYKKDESSLFLESICNRMNQIDADRVLNLIFHQTTWF